jgi:hypothetical protein
MTQKAVFTGVYSDARMIKSRSVAMVSIEIPIERYQEFIALFGAPIPGESKWVAIAAMGSEPAIPDDPQSEKKASLAQIAGIKCNDVGFQKWLWVGFPAACKRATDDEHGVALDGDVVAARVVRSLCKVASRADLDKSAESADKFRKLLAMYDSHVAQRSMGMAK